MNGAWWAIVVAAGRGERIGAPVNKVMLPLEGRPMLEWSLAAFQRVPEVAGVVLVGRRGELAALRRMVRERSFDRVRAIVAGGRARQDSVRRGLAAVPEEAGVVLVHDAARPYVTAELIARVGWAAADAGAAVPVIPETDSLRRVEAGKVVGEVNREGAFRAQTPQGFHRRVLAAALDRADPALPLSDEGAAVRMTGHEVVAVAGDAQNIKVTTTDDYFMAELIARGRAEHRIGFGYDVHRLVPDRPLVLGGIILPFELGLEGHSDADALLHALMDALLGCACLGDIGKHFPPGDPRFRNASSSDLLRQVAALLAAQGATVVNVDATVVAEAPRLAPHIDAMRLEIARALAISASRVSVKATTNEQMGFAGRREGIAAMAVAQILLPAGPR